MRGGANPQVKAVLNWVKSQIGKSDQIVEEWHDANSFYRKHASGYIEQGGMLSYGGSYRDWNYVTTFPTAFSESYKVFVEPRSSDNSTGQIAIANTGVGIYTTDRTKFNCRIYGHGSSDKLIGFCWYACGY